jgi:hypothetical protein
LSLVPDRSSYLGSQGTTLQGYAGDRLRVSGSGWVKETALVRLGGRTLQPVAASETELEVVLVADLEESHVVVLSGERVSAESGQSVRTLGPGHPAAGVMVPLEPQVTITVGGTVPRNCLPSPDRQDGGAGGPSNDDCTRARDLSGLVAVAFNTGSTLTYTGDSYLAYVPALGWGSSYVGRLPGLDGGRRVLNAVRPFRDPDGGAAAVIHDTVVVGGDPGDGGPGTRNNRVMLGKEVLVEGTVAPLLLPVGDSRLAGVERVGCDGGACHRVRAYGLLPDGGGGWLSGWPGASTLAGRVVAGGTVQGGWDPLLNPADPEVLTLGCDGDPGDGTLDDVWVHTMNSSTGEVTSRVVLAPDLVMREGELAVDCQGPCARLAACPECASLLECQDSPFCGLTTQAGQTDLDDCLANGTCRCLYTSAALCRDLPGCASAADCQTAPNPMVCQGFQECQSDPACTAALACSEGPCVVLASLRGGLACAASPACRANLRQALDCRDDPACQVAYGERFVQECGPGADGGPAPTCPASACACLPKCRGMTECLQDPACFHAYTCASIPGCAELGEVALRECAASGDGCEQLRRCVLGEDPQCRVNSRYARLTTGEFESRARCIWSTCSDAPPRQLVPVWPGHFLVLPPSGGDPLERTASEMCVLELGLPSVEPMGIDFPVSAAAVFPSSTPGEPIRVFLIRDDNGPTREILFFDSRDGFGLAPTRTSYAALHVDPILPLVYALPVSGGRVDMLTRDGSLVSTASVLGPPVDGWPLDQEDGRVLLVNGAGAMLVDRSGMPSQFEPSVFLPAATLLEGEPGRNPVAAWTVVSGEESPVGYLLRTPLDLDSGRVEPFQLMAQLDSDLPGGSILRRLQPVALDPDGMVFQVVADIPGGGVLRLARTPPVTEPVPPGGTGVLTLAAFPAPGGTNSFVSHDPRNRWLYVNTYLGDHNTVLQRLSLAPDGVTTTVTGDGVPRVTALAAAVLPSGVLVGTFVTNNVELGAVDVAGRYRRLLEGSPPFGEASLVVSPDGRRLYAGVENGVVEVALDAAGEDVLCLDAAAEVPVCPRVLQVIPFTGRPDVLRVSHSGSTLLVLDAARQSIHLLR